ncbi:hypothetical protein ACPOL_5460 [Acidisarcina polymorpha]|uniref:Uncharacterized protein n=1 Tax=Acidisarcina polymorpha TaxID=2211140 RepID=A0A2Z5G6J0_9BACT|nr:hypothetical protein ACPOL_5460 [Acidisarcina polymorpha]
MGTIFTGEYEVCHGIQFGLSVKRLDRLYRLQQDAFVSARSFLRKTQATVHGN